MAVNDRQGKDLKPYSLQHIANQSFDQSTQISMVESVGYDGQNMQRVQADALAVKFITSGNDVYVGLAAPGTALATAKWQAFKYTDADGTVSYADGDSNYDNIATDLTTLTYS